MERTSCVMSLIKDETNQHAMYKDEIWAGQFHPLSITQT